MAAPDIEMHYWDGSNYTSFNAPIQSITINRGRSRQLTRFEAGTATINFYNGDRLLDPLNNSSAYQDLVVPRLKVQVLADNKPIFTGLVTDWDIDYELDTRDRATAFCADEFTLLSNIRFTDVTSTIEGTPGPRIQDVLNNFSYNGDTVLDHGNANLGGYDIPFDTQLTDYVFNVAASDNGNFFVAADGSLTYVSRFGRPPVSEVTLADDTTGVGYSALTNAYGDELLYNRVALTSPAGTVAVENTTSVESFGPSVLTVNNLLNSNLVDLSWLATNYVELYGEPLVRFTGAQVELAGVGSSSVADLLDIDLADQVSLKKTFGIGSPGSVTQNLFVSGIQHDIRPGSHMIKFSFETSPYKNVFLLDSTTNGILNTDVLG
jgi:hypothetical protein